MANLFDKVKKGIVKGVITVGVKSREILETQKFKGKIGKLQEQKKGALEEIGNIVYTMFCEASFDEERIKAKCETISGLNTQIKENEEQLKQIHLETQKKTSGEQETKE
jgi:N-acetylglucosamine kinase-like BadF-type ATPase